MTTGASLFGLGGATGSTSLFGQPASGSTLFNNTGALFGGKNTLFGGQTSLFSSTAPKKDENEDGENEGDDDDDEPNEASNSPPAFAADHAEIPGVTDKPLKLNIVPMKQEPNQFTKVFRKQVEKFKIVPKAATTTSKGAAEE